MHFREVYYEILHLAIGSICQTRVWRMGKETIAIQLSSVFDVFKFMIGRGRTVAQKGLLERLANE